MMMDDNVDSNNDNGECWHRCRWVEEMKASQMVVRSARLDKAMVRDKRCENFHPKR
jgi:hypothetical protein